ncbi:MAG: hypothetical protein CMM74_14570 [Rhodospirillaceae bacterium]|nr:hypothetical protein [Rhodospirillaceae bacterium]
MGSKSGSQENGRFSVKRKTEAVLRLLRGEDLDSLSREYKVTAGKLSQWRDAFVARGQSGLQSGVGDRAIALKVDISQDFRCFSCLDGRFSRDFVSLAAPQLRLQLFSGPFGASSKPLWALTSRLKHS